MLSNTKYVLDSSLSKTKTDHTVLVNKLHHIFIIYLNPAKIKNNILDFSGYNNHKNYSIEMHLFYFIKSILIQEKLSFFETSPMAIINRLIDCISY